MLRSGNIAKAGYAPGRRGRFIWSDAIRTRDSYVSLFAEGSGLHRVPPITVGVWLLCRLLTSARTRSRLPVGALPVEVAGSGGDSRRFPPGPQSGSRDQRGPPIEQISPDKAMNFPHTTAAFTLPRDTGGLRHVVLTRPRARPSMRFLSVGSCVCARASFRQRLAAMPLPSASSCHRRKRQCRVSYRGLAPHQFMPMPGVHNGLHRTAASRNEG